jgi:hypothetical protein
MSDRQILQLLVDALNAMLASGGSDGALQAQIKVDQAQAALLAEQEDAK